MSATNTPVLFIDTSSLRRAGIGHPDLQKLFIRSKEGALRVAISHIAWEEWRTQQLEQERKLVREMRTRFDKLRETHISSHILRRLPQPEIVLWSDTEIESASKDALADYVSEYRIEIVGIAPHHGHRTWTRYFAADAPFNPADERTNRRKDIPDSWILEAAIDLLNEGNIVLALCHDDKLHKALVANGAKGFKEPIGVLSELDRSDAPAATTDELGMTLQASDPLSSILFQANERFKDLDRRIVGFVAYLEAASKQQLFALLDEAGIAIEAASNVADRLVLAGVIDDTGNHYLLKDRKLADRAASEVESEVIALLARS